LTACHKHHLSFQAVSRKQAISRDVLVDQHKENCQLSRLIIYSCTE
jgi:hypothetical protein